MTPERRELALATKGFMPADEGDALWDAAVAAAEAVPGTPMLEVGSYCGRSTIWLGDAAERSAVVLFAVDHHRGSEENQAGWDHHDTEVVDDRIGKMDTLPFFRAAIHDAELEDSVIAVVGRSPLVASAWTTISLMMEKEVADIVGIPFDEIQQACLTPLAYTVGTDFKRAMRPDPDTIIHWDTW